MMHLMPIIYDMSHILYIYGPLERGSVLYGGRMECAGKRTPAPR